MSDSPFLSVGEVAGMLRVSTKWVYQHIRDFPGAFRFPNSKTWFIDRETFLDSLKQKALSKAQVRKPDGSKSRHGL
jgi:hypothetical protein